MELRSGTSGYGKLIFGFDAAQQLYSRTDQTGAVMENRRDLAGRVFQRDYRASAGSAILDSDLLTYDRVSRLLSGTKGRFSNTISLTYDVAGRVESESLAIAGKTYTVQSEYDQRGQLSKLTYPDASVVDRTYTARGQLEQVLYQGLVYDTRTYDDGGRPQTITYRNGVVTTDVWRDDSNGMDNLLEQITTTHPSGVTAVNDKVGDFSFQYDANQNITWQTITGTLSPYGFEQSQFDNEDRLVQWNRKDGNKDQSWILSFERDWTSFTEQATTTARTHNNAHEIVTLGSQTLQHDVKGNLTQSTGNQSYGWDQDNHLIDADYNGGGTDVTFEYDVLGRRVGKSVNGQYSHVYVYANDQVLMEYERGTDTGYRKYLYGSYVDEPTVMFRPWNGGWAAQYYHRNSRFDVVALTWPSGKVAERYAYDAYGNPVIMAPGGGIRSQPATDNPYLFTGRRRDKETGLYYFRARYFDSELGRFLSRDPSGYPDGMNSYGAYMVPNYQDPYGLQSSGNPTLEVLKSLGRGISSLWTRTHPRHNPPPCGMFPHRPEPKHWDEPIKDSFLLTPLANELRALEDDHDTVTRNLAENSNFSPAEQASIARKFTAANALGIRGIDDSFHKHDAVDGHVQSSGERFVDGVTGSITLGSTVIPAGRAIGRTGSRMAGRGTRAGTSAATREGAVVAGNAGEEVITRAQRVLDPANRNKVVLDENVFFMEDELRRAGFDVEKVVAGTKDPVIRKQLEDSGARFVTQNYKDFKGLDGVIRVSGSPRPIEEQLRMTMNSLEIARVNPEVFARMKQIPASGINIKMVKPPPTPSK